MFAKYTFNIFSEVVFLTISLLKRHNDFKIENKDGMYQLNKGIMLINKI